MYHYRAFVQNVVDGDTVDVRLDLGCKVFVEKRLRLARINAWEVRGTERPAGLIARDWLRGKILGKHCIIETIRDRTGKYGRLLAEIEIDGGNINDALVANNHARDY